MSDILFPSGQPIHEGRRLHTQPLYDFCLRSNRPHAIQARQFWNELFAQCDLPLLAKGELKAGFTSKSSVDHMGALTELFLYELLVRTGHKVRYHRELKKGRPDFLVTSPDGTEFYLEATCALGDEHPDKYDNRKRGVIYDTIDHIDSDKFKVDYSIRGDFNGTNISEKRLRGEIVSLLGSTDHSQLLEDQKTLSLSECEIRYGKRLSVGGATVYVTPYALAKPRTNNGMGLIRFGSSGEMQLVITDRYLFKSIKKKADQFKEADLPIVVAINIQESFLDDDDVLNALFGQQHHTRPFGAFRTDQIQEHRGPEGIWIYKGRPKNTSIAAVWLFAQTGILVTPARKPVMIMNPFLDGHKIPCSLPFVDYYMPSRDGLILNRLGIDPLINDREAWRRDWPLSYKSY